MTELQTMPVPSDSENGAEGLRRAIQRREPVKVAGLISHWEASRWTFDSLRQAVGDQIITAMLDLPDSGALDDIQQAYEKVLTFAEFLDRAEQATAGNACYLGYSRLAELI